MNLLQELLLDARRNFAGPDGRDKALRMFLGVATEHEPTPLKVKREPLGDRLGYQRYRINPDKVIDLARQGQSSLAMPDYKQLVDPLRQVVHEVLSHYPGMAIQSFEDQFIMGKDNTGFAPKPYSHMLDFADENWRRIDVLRSLVGAGWPVHHSDLDKLRGKNPLGDGVVAVVQPKLLGLDERMVDFFQVRVLVGEPGFSHTFGKGLVIVHPSARNVIAWDDLYGYKAEQGDVTFYDMVQGSEYLPGCGYTDQGLTYQRVPDAHIAMFGLENLRLIHSKGSRLTEAKLLAADVPLYALGGYGLLALVSQIMKLNLSSGHSRMALPAKAFEYIDDLKGLALIEQQLAEGDKQWGVPYYYAPKELEGYYERFQDSRRRVRRVLNRRPDLPTGQSTWLFELLGYQPFNAFVVPSWSLSYAGLDFDGDLICDFPTPEQGGLYQAFNALPQEERELRLQAGMIARKEGGAKPVYASPLHRWAGQLESRAILGQADVSARRFLDAADMYDALGEQQFARNARLMAYGLQAWVQVAVDRQKRPVDWPHPSGTQLMPRIRAPLGSYYLSDLIRHLTKDRAVSDMDGEEFLGPYDQAWANVEKRYQSLLMLAGAVVNPQHVLGSPERIAAASRWAHEVHVRYQQALQSVPLVADTGRPAPFEVRFKQRVPSRPPAVEGPYAMLEQTVVVLDHFWNQIVTFKGSDSRTGVFNLKDGLVDAAIRLGISEQLAELCTNYALFREFASVAQLQEFFAGMPGMRVSDVFLVLDERNFERVVPEDPAARPYYVNTSTLQVGFFTLKPGELKFSRSPHGYHFELPQGSYNVRARVLNDALIRLGIQLYDKLPPIDLEPYKAFYGLAEPEPMDSQAAASTTDLQAALNSSDPTARLAAQLAASMGMSALPDQERATPVQTPPPASPTTTLPGAVARSGDVEVMQDSLRAALLAALGHASS